LCLNINDLWNLCKNLQTFLANFTPQANVWSSKGMTPEANEKTDMKYNINDRNTGETITTIDADDATSARIEELSGQSAEGFFAASEIPALAAFGDRVVWAE